MSANADAAIDLPRYELFDLANLHREYRKALGYLDRIQRRDPSIHPSKRHALRREWTGRRDAVAAELAARRERL